VPVLNHLNGVSCVNDGICVAVDDNGNVVTSMDPTSGSEAWTVTNVDGPNSLNGVTCPSSTLCVVVDAVGNVIIGTAVLTTTTGG
jgi:hypothetical protein